MCCITVSFFPLRLVKAFVVLFSIGLLVSDIRVYIQGLCRNKYVLGCQSQKNEHLDLLWKISPLKLIRACFLTWNYFGQLTDPFICFRNSPCDTSEALHNYLPICFSDFCYIHCLLSNGHSLSCSRFLRGRGSPRLLFGARFRLLGQI